LEAACAFAESRIEGYRKQLQRIEDLETEVKHVHATTEPARFRQMKARFAATGLTDDDWAQFGMNFVGDVPDVIKRARDAIERAIAVVNGGDPDQPPLCQRHLRQSLPDIFVPMGGEWSPRRAETTPSSRSKGRPRRGGTRAQVA
jgi:hypothetical protein